MTMDGAHLSRTEEADDAQRLSFPANGGVVYRRSERARNYRLTLRRDGSAVATVPRRGSLREAERFVANHGAWLERARRKLRTAPREPEVWTPGTRILWRGEDREIRIAVAGARPAVALGSDVIPVPRLEADLRPELERHFIRRAGRELTERAWELAAETRVPVGRVAVRNQKSRWGSCSRAGTISLNWRLIRTPDFVRDYIIYHELMHLKEMNHSERFWARVQEVCPGWREAERWLKRHGRLAGL